MEESPFARTKPGNGIDTVTGSVCVRSGRGRLW